MLKTRTSIAPISRSIRSTSAATSASTRASRPKRISLAAFRANRLRERVDGVGVARPSGDADVESLAGEGARDRSAEPVAGPDHQTDAASLPRAAHAAKPGATARPTRFSVMLNAFLPSSSGPSRPWRQKIGASRAKAGESRENKIACICFLLLFGIQTFQWVTAKKIKKNRSPFFSLPSYLPSRGFVPDA